MQKYFSLIILLAFSCNQQQTLDTEELARELDSIMVLDQKYRPEMQEVLHEFGWDSPEMGELWQKQNEIDQSNLKRILEIIKTVEGYPGKSMVGISASSTAFYVLQHAPDSILQQYYDLIINAAKENELDKSLAAMYQDRCLMHRGEPQIFGTQLRSEYQTDSLTGERIQRTFVWPIADTTNIDSLRMLNGLGSLEEYLNSFGISRWE